MPEPTCSRTAAPRRPWRMLALAAAGLWLFLLGCLAAVQTASASTPQPAGSRVAPLTPTSTSILPTLPTGTTPPSDPTATGIPSATGTGSAPPSVTATKVATATATPASNDNGGGYGDGGGATPANGAQPTKVVFSQPTGGSSDDGPLQGLTPGAFGSNGLLIAMTMSCLVGVLGLVVAAVAITVLVRGGYGPFLKALLRGKRAGQPRGKGKGKNKNANGPGASDDDDDGWGASRDGWGASQEYGSFADSYEQPARSARAPVGARRNAGPAARTRQPTPRRGDRW